MSKQHYRRLMKEQLSRMDNSSHLNMSSLLSKNLLQLLSDLHVIQEKKWIGAFAPLASEPIWHLAMGNSLENRLAFPAEEVRDGALIFRASSLQDLKPKRDFGVAIPGPDLDKPKVVPDVLLIPALAFSLDAMRLGRGKGYYDKYLATFVGIKIGLCFSFQLLDELPSEKHDQKVDFIVTENEILNSQKWEPQK